MVLTNLIERSKYLRIFAYICIDKCYENWTLMNLWNALASICVCVCMYVYFGSLLMPSRYAISRMINTSQSRISNAMGLTCVPTNNLNEYRKKIHAYQIYIYIYIHISRFLSQSLYTRLTFRCAWCGSTSTAFTHIHQDFFSDTWQWPLLLTWFNFNPSMDK